MELEPVFKIKAIHELVKIHRIRPRKEKTGREKKEPRKHRKCPVDVTGLEQLNIEGTIIDICPVCNGIWFDPGELERLFTKEILEKQLLIKQEINEYNNQMEKNCPVCGSSLLQKKNYYTGTLYEICPTCAGLWLDGGEFAVLYLDERTDRSGVLVLPEVLGKYIDVDV